MAEKRPENMKRITTPELAKAFISEQLDLIKKQVGNEKTRKNVKEIRKWITA